MIELLGIAVGALVLGVLFLYVPEVLIGRVILSIENRESNETFRMVLGLYLYIHHTKLVLPIEQKLGIITSEKILHRLFKDELV